MVFESGNRVSVGTEKLNYLNTGNEGCFARGKTGNRVKNIECKLKDLKKAFIENIGKRKNKEGRRK
jgi:hypothetical protein